MRRFFITAIFAGLALAALAQGTPAFPGGEKALKDYITKNTVYPKEARENSVEGVVTVSFTVAADGSLSDIKVVRLVDPDLEKEAIRVVTAMPAWTPAENQGVPVAAQTTVEIPFILE